MGSLGLILCAVSLGAWGGKTADSDAAFDTITTTIETPHTRAWGMPLAGGAIRALFVAPRFTLRDVCELAQRLELEYDTCALGEQPDLSSTVPADFPLSADRVKKTLSEKLAEKYDVVVMGNVDLALLPEEILSTITQKVKQGMGLVVFNYGTAIPARMQSFLDTFPSATPDTNVTKPPKTPSDTATPESEHTTTPDQTVIRGIGEKLAPEWPTGLGFVKTFQGEQGRVVCVNFLKTRVIHHFMIPPLTEPLRARNEHLETYYSLAARAVRWAAGRNAKCWVTGLEDTGTKGPSEEEIPSGLPDAYIQQMKDAVIQNLYQSYLVHFNAPADKPYRVVVQVRDPNRGRTTQYNFDKRPLPKGATSYAMDLPLGSGSYYLDFWLMDKEKVEEWHTETIQVSSLPAINNLTFSQGWLKPNDSLTISMEIRPRIGTIAMLQPGGRTMPAYHVAYARALDSLGRLVAETQEKVPNEGGNVQLALHFADLLTRLVKVEVYATVPLESRLTEADLGLGAYGFMYLPVRNPSRPHAFEWAIETDAAHEYNGRYSVHTLESLGVSTAVLTRYPEEDGGNTLAPPLDGARFSLAQANLWAIPEVVDYAFQSAPNEPCLSDPAYLEKKENTVKKRVTAFWPTGTSVYSLGGHDCRGDGISSSCRSPLCLAGFQSLIAHQYSSLDALNQTWGTAFSDWDAVSPPDYKTARESKQYAGWLDYQLYADTVFTGALLRGGDAVHGADPKGKALVHAPACANTPLDYDWQVLSTELDAVAVPFVPNALLPEWVTAYRVPSEQGSGEPRRRYAALTTGPVDSDLVQWLPWYAVLHGFDALWQEDALRGGGVMPDGRPRPTETVLATSVSQIKSGLDAVLLSAKPVPKQIVIYDSQASRYLAAIASSTPGNNEAYAAAAAFRKLIADSGRQTGFITSAQVVQGMLSEYKVLCMPSVRVLSDAEVAAITAFVAQGGFVIADILPGERDEHARVRETSPLESFFGIRRGLLEAGGDLDAGRYVAVHAQVDYPGPEDKMSAKKDKKADEKTFSISWSEGRVDRLVSMVESAKAYGKSGESPIWITNGQTLLLNHTVQEMKSPELVHVMDALLENKEIPRTLPIRELIPGTECFLYQLGNTQIMAVLANPFEKGLSAKTEIMIASGHTGHDLLAKKPTAYTKDIPVKLNRGELLLAASLPYKVSELKLTTLNQVEQGKRLPFRIGVKASVETPGTHVVHVTLQRTTGELLRHYTQDLVCAKGQGDGYIPLALNETPGIYQLTVWDVLSGIATRKIITVTSGV